MATSAQFRPRLGYAVADAATLNPPKTQLVADGIRRVYVVQESDTLGDLARRLYGANVPQARDRIRVQGFYPGSEITY
jgi:hypothetical protein